VYIYMPDETERRLKVKAAAGTTARIVLETDHQLRIGGPTLPGQVATDHVYRSAEARGEHTALFGETALPGARSEVAFPLVVADQLIAVLDLQSIHFDAFSEQDIAILSFLAEQAAIALDHAEKTRQLQAASPDRIQARRGYLKFSGGQTPREQVDSRAWRIGENGMVTQAPIEPHLLHLFVQAIEKRQPVVSTLSDKAHGSNPADRGIQRHVLTLPVQTRGQTVGALQLVARNDTAWRADQICALKELCERMGLALETTRLSEENRLRGEREWLVGHVTSRIRETLQVDTMLQSAAREIGQALGLSEVRIRLGDARQSTDDGDANEVNDPDTDRGNEETDV
jgi:GAF domain-containing protein